MSSEGLHEPPVPRYNITIEKAIRVNWPRPRPLYWRISVARLLRPGGVVQWRNLGKLESAKSMTHGTINREFLPLEHTHPRCIETGIQGARDALKVRGLELTPLQEALYRSANGDI